LAETLFANEKIRAREVRVVGANGENLGIMNIRDAVAAAREAGLDLLEISPTASPPVCKIADYGKWKYDEQKRQAAIRKSQKIVEIKELKVRPNIDVADFNVKIKAARRFIEDGDKVKFMVRFRGREITNQESGAALLTRIRESLADIAKIDKDPVMDGRLMVMIIAPAK
jgi:translation initiation factor IF-3